MLEKVARDHRVPVVDGELADRRTALQTGIVHEDVGNTLLRDELLDLLLHVTGVRDVEAHRGRKLASDLGDLVCRGRQRIRVTPVQRDARARLGETERECASEAAR